MGRARYRMEVSENSTATSLASCLYLKYVAIKRLRDENLLDFPDSFSFLASDFELFDRPMIVSTPCDGFFLTLLGGPLWPGQPGGGNQRSQNYRQRQRLAKAIPCSVPDGYLSDFPHSSLAGAYTRAGQFPRANRLSSLRRVGFLRRSRAAAFAI